MNRAASPSRRRAWFAQAVEVLGGPDAVQGMVREALTAAASPGTDVGTAWLDAAADRCYPRWRNTALHLADLACAWPGRNATSGPRMRRWPRLIGWLT